MSLAPRTAAQTKAEIKWLVTEVRAIPGATGLSSTARVGLLS